MNMEQSANYNCNRKYCNPEGHAQYTTMLHISVGEIVQPYTQQEVWKEFYWMMTEVQDLLEWSVLRCFRELCENSDL